MSSSIIFVYDKKILTESKRNNLINYAKTNNFGLHFGYSNALVQGVVDDVKDNQDYFILSDAQFHDTVDEILSWNWLLTKDKLVKHHAYLDRLKDILRSDDERYSFEIYVSFESYSYLSEYETAVNTVSISQYFADYISTHYLMPNPTKFVYYSNFEGNE